MSSATLAKDLAAAVDPVAFGSTLSFDAEPWQRKLLRSPARRVLVRCSRQVGKTQTTSIKALHTARFNPGALVLIISPTQRQSDEMLLRIRTLHRATSGGVAKLAKDSNTEMGMENGSRIVSLPGTEGTSRGFAGAKLIVLDEAARIEDDIFAAVLPMVASDGAIWALSTPWGRRGWFFNLHEQPGNGWERHKVTCYESGQYTPERIAEAKASVSSFVFASDYEVQFGDNDSQLFATENVRAAFTPTVTPLF